MVIAKDVPILGGELNDSANCTGSNTGGEALRAGWDRDRNEDIPRVRPGRALVPETLNMGVEDLEFVLELM